MLISKDLKILFANEAFLRRKGMKRSDVIGQHCYKITHNSNKPCKPPQDPCPIQRVVRTGKPTVELHKHFIGGNKEILVNVTAASIKEGNKTCFLHITIPAKEGIKKIDCMNDALEKTLNVLRVVDLYQEQIEDVKEKSIQLEKTKNDLENKINELEKFNKLSVGRELRMVELKKRINSLEKSV
ncbi:MAG: PAS domain-containing protein [Candidatus Aenigmatarchaeota archaeon]